MSATLLSLPVDILILLPEYVHNIEDYTNLASTCRTLRHCMDTATPNTILRLAAKQSSTFFRPSPLFLVTATARELGQWARQSVDNEAELAVKLENGVDALLDLALEHCGLTMKRIRELYEMRFSIINPVTDIIDKCVGEQWMSLPDFWTGGVDDAATIHAEPGETLLHLAIYGELFGPDFEIFLNQETERRMLTVQTRLEFIKYAVPDIHCTEGTNYLPRLGPGVQPDPRKHIKAVGPYARKEGDCFPALRNDHASALAWLLQSTRWHPYWDDFRAKAGPDFQDQTSMTREQRMFNLDWKQKMWQSVMLCQGLDGLAMIRPGLQDAWIDKAREWRDKISRLKEESETVRIARVDTYKWPYVVGDLKICLSHRGMN